MSKALRQLQKKWYKKLKAEGFDDIEHDEYNLKQYHARYFSYRYEDEEFEAGQRYYELAAQFLYEHNFNTSAEKSIWDLHSQGYTVRDIAKKKKKARSVVHKIITQLRKVMLGQG